MDDARQLIPASGLVATIAVAMYMVVQLHGQTTPLARDYSNAAAAEVRDPSGRVVLRGEFVHVDNNDADVERKATLAATGVDADATGDVEIEVSRVSPTEQEIDLAVRGIERNTPYTLAIDGRPVASSATDDRGWLLLELRINAVREER